MSDSELRRRIAGWQMASERESAERGQAGADPRRSIEGFFDLIALYDQLHGWPPPESEVRRREAQQRREDWVRVRDFYREREGCVG